MTKDTLEGQEVAGYKVQQVLGEGASGVVYRAISPGGRAVALKLLREDSRDRIEVTRRFRREAEVHRQLAHPNLVVVHDVGYCEQGPYLAMELIEGGPLSSRLVAEGAMSSSAVISAATGLTAGLAYLHDKGVLHRDIKPSNILVGERKIVKLADFGLARQETSTLLTAEQSLLGTLSYIAPEVVEGAAPAASADVYSLGLVLLEMIQGKPVFPPDEIEVMIRRIVRGTVPSPTQSGFADVDENLEALVMRMVVRDPAARPTSAAVAAELRALARPAGGPRSRASARPPATREMHAGDAPPSQAISSPTTTLFLEVAEKVPRWVVGSIAVIAVTLGLTLGLRSPPGPMPRVSDPQAHGESAPPPSAVTGVPDRGTPEEIRAQLAGIEDLVDRYDRGCPVATGESTETGMRAMFLGDTFFRSREGDLSLLFTALSRMAEAVERGDKDHLEDPVWLEMALTALDLLEEVARSNGFDTGSRLGRPLARLEAAVSSQPGRFRVQLGHVFHSACRYYRSLGVKPYLDHIDIHAVVLEHLELAPPGWQVSARGRATRAGFFRRSLLQLELLMTMEPDSREPAIRQRLQDLDRRALQDIQRDRDMLVADLGRPGPQARWAICQIASYGMRFLQEDEANLRLSIEIFNTIAPELRLGDIRPRWRSEATRSLFIIERVRTLRPQLGVAAGPKIPAERP